MANTPSSSKLLVVGNGMAGARTVEEIINRGGRERFEITMIGDEPYGNYNRIMLSHVLSGEAAVDDEDLILNPMGWYTANGVTLHAGDRAVALDRFAKTVTCESGRVVDYDVLIIATGSNTFFPNMDGLREADGRLARGVFGFRNIADTNGMLQMAQAHDDVSAVVIGGGLLGLEAAYGLRTQGLEVNVVHSPGHLMNQQLDERGGSMLRSEIEKLGVGVHTSMRTTAVLRDDAGRVTGVSFVDGSTLDADMVVVTAGIRPNVEMARAAGLVVERGIVVDDQMRCEDEGSVYAVGECAQHRGETYGLVAPVWEQSVILAEVLTGTNPEAAYVGSRTTTQLKVAGVDVAAMGVKGPETADDEFVQYYEPATSLRHSTGRSRCPKNASVCSSTSAHPASRPVPPICPTTCRCVIATESARAIWSRVCTPGPQHCPQCAHRRGQVRAAGPARDSSPTSWRPQRVVNWRSTRPPTGMCPASRCPSPT
jgi:nitrite reductase (NADH) large subunit